MKIFKRKEIFKVESEAVQPEDYSEPKTAEEFFNRGMAFYARKKYGEAEDDMLKALSLDRNYIDAHYSLGMVHKAQGKKEEAIEAFQKTLNLLGDPNNEQNSKYDMLKRLAKGHINEISIGDWDLEKEVWKRTE
jgi:tetratricopeptide (TPR) repeat protein